MSTPASGNTSRAPSAFAKRTGEDHLRRLNAYEINPEVEALMRKIIPDIEGGVSTSRHLGNGQVNVPDPAYLQQIAGTIGQSTTDATSLMQLLPDLTLVMNLLTSAILAPKDLTSTELNFKVDRSAFHLPISGRLLDVVKDHFTNVYNIKGLCPTILKEIIFLTGSYAVAVIPENSVDAMINGTTGYSTESYNEALMPILDSNGQYKPMGILGPGPVEKKEKERASGTKLLSAMESLRGPMQTARPESAYAKALGKDFEDTVVITDNINVAKFSALLEAKRRVATGNAIANSVGLEAGLSNYYGGGGGYANYALGGAQRSRTTFSHAALVQAIKTNEMLVKPMVGHPLVMRLPSESIIPVFISPEKHLGYFVLLDAEGNPLRLANRKDIYNDLSTSNNGTASSTQGASQMIQMTQNLSIGVNPRENPKDPQQMVKIYGQLLEHELKARLSNGVYGPSAKVDVSDDVYAVMLARSLKRQQTQILYIPAELMVYMAFDYAENGTGRSITEQTKIIGAMRAMLGFSNVMAGIKNSVSRQRVTLQLSDNDIDPSKTIARSIDEYTRRRNVTMPFVASDPADMISYINMAGVEWNIEGKGAPAHKIDIEDKQTNRAKVDVDLDNMLRDRHYMAYGVTPEAVIASTGADFATSVVTNNQMFAKRVITYQDQFTPFLEQLVRTVTLNSATLMNKLREIVVSSVKDLQKHGDDKNDKEDIVDRTKDSALAKPAPNNGIGIYAQEAIGSSNPNDKKTVLVDYQSKEDEQRVVDLKNLPLETMRLVDQIVFQFIDSVRIHLPRPDTATEEAQATALEHHEAFLEKALAYYIDAAFLGQSNLGEYAGHLDEIKAGYKAYFMRQWMRNNGVLPELEDIVAVDEEGIPELDLQKMMTEHAELVASGLNAYLAGIGQLREEIKTNAADLTGKFPDAGLTEQGAGANGAGGFDNGGGFGGGGGGFGGEPGGGDEFGNDEFASTPPGTEEPFGEPGGGEPVGAPEDNILTGNNPQQNGQATADDLTGEADEEEELDENGNPIKKPEEDDNVLQ